MASSAFKSTTKRSPIGTTSSTNDPGSSKAAHRRSRSLSRFSHPLPASDLGGETPARRGRFVNTVRGSDYTEISLDDLALEFFPLKDLPDETVSSDRGRASQRGSEIGRWASGTASSQSRGRSVSRQNPKASERKSSVSNSSGGGRGVSEANSRRRRSVSVVRYQISDSEGDIDHSESSSKHANFKSSSGNGHLRSLQKPTASSHRRLGRSLSQKDLLKLHDGYSSPSSALTEDEGRDCHSSKNAIEKTIRAVYAQKKAEHPTGDDVNSGLYEAMRKELRYAVEEIRTELEQATVRKTSALGGDKCLQLNSSDFQDFSAIRKNYATKLEKSEKRKQDLLAEILLEEQRGKELSKIVRELHPDPKSSAVAQKPLRARKRSNDRNKMSKRLTDEAEKYFEGFISNIEDTDFSSFDGERSDESSSLGGITKPRDAGETETCLSPAGYNSLPAEMDGVVLPWLQWETSNNDGSPTRCKIKSETPVTPKTLSWDAAQHATLMQDLSGHSISSCGSWSPGLVNEHTVDIGEASRSKSREVGSYRMSHFDMDEYLKLQHNEDLLFERWRERQRIDSGGLLLCSNHVL